MKQLTVISGKGGTGKTTITAAFAHLAGNAVLADCDVDAPDLHMILHPEVQKTIPFSGLKIAVKDDDKCTDCGLCREHCRFDAVSKDFQIIRESCEGCGVCEFVCPTDAIEMVDRSCGRAFTSTTRFGPMSHAELFTAEEASGKLVTLVRNNARILADENGRDLVIIDGPPGIGCPVIASIAGADLVLVVTEPTLSGIHDLERVLGVAAHFGVPAVVCINKYDINLDNTERIVGYCKDVGSEVVGRLGYDDAATDAMIAGKTVTELGNSDLSNGIGALWSEVRKALQ